MPRRKSAVVESPKDVIIDDRATESVYKLGLTREQVQASLELALSHSYKEAERQEALDMFSGQRKVETSPETLREWTKDRRFVEAVGWATIGLADNGED